ncbi:GTP-binding protein [Nitrosococcus wardiae]|uniref:GTP-binding protein n=2 Tax=Nitrosococcus wardiae TaxID=1814290 RepID=A0A4P7C1W2_9GAMM|nr:GTP-binding protein [Nitrosococcus wardiae]
MANHKLIFTGPVGAGKTTAISVLSDIPLVSTDEVASDMTQQKKPKTTVAMDYGLMNLSATERIHLYGTPGQERFDFMWDILTEGGIGLVLLIDNSRANPFQDMHFFLDAFREFIVRTGVVIGISRMDVDPQPKITDYYQELEGFAKKPPIFEVDARNRRDISLLVQALLYSLDPELVGANG